MDHGVKPNKDVRPNLVNWANNGPCIRFIKVMDLELGFDPIKGNGHDGLSGTFLPSFYVV